MIMELKNKWKVSNTALAGGVVTEVGGGGGLLPSSAVSGFTGLRNQSSFWSCDYRVKNQG